MPEPDYLRLVATASVIIDTPGYGGGANTVYDAVAAGTPTVTLPGPLHRSRWAAAVNRRLQLDELNVISYPAYLATATKVGTDAEYRAFLRQKLRDADSQIFNDLIPVRDLREFFMNRMAAVQNQPD